MDREQVAEITSAPAPTPKASPEVYKLIRQQSWLMQRVSSTPPMMPIEQRILSIAERAQHGGKIVVTRYPHHTLEAFPTPEDASMATLSVNQFGTPILEDSLSDP